jgi:hypothetical protein
MAASRHRCNRGSAHNRIAPCCCGSFFVVAVAAAAVVAPCLLLLAVAALSCCWLPLRPAAPHLSSCSLIVPEQQRWGSEAPIAASEGHPPRVWYCWRWLPSVRAHRPQRSAQHRVVFSSADEVSTVYRDVPGSPTATALRLSLQRSHCFCCRGRLALAEAWLLSHTASSALPASTCGLLL